MTIRIVTHCYAIELPQYASFLSAQLWSIKNYAPEGTKVTIVTNMEDKRTIDVYNQWKYQIPEGSVHLLFLHQKELFNRAIGRNMVALKQNENVVWFTDADHVFGEGCLQSVLLQIKAKHHMKHIYYPNRIKIHKDHQLGDECWQKLEKEGKFEINENDFEKKRYNRAIGGVQIVPGHLAREHGYLNDYPQFRQPTDGSKPFPSFVDDVKFRGFCHNRWGSFPLQVPNLYRLRHTRVTYK